LAAFSLSAGRQMIRKMPNVTASRVPPLSSYTVIDLLRRAGSLGMGLAAVSAWFQEPCSALELGIC
jgi:hypothetical protein